MQKFLDPGSATASLLSAGFAASAFRILTGNPYKTKSPRSFERDSFVLCAQQEFRSPVLGLASCFALATTKNSRPRRFAPAPLCFAGLRANLSSNPAESLQNKNTPNACASGVFVLCAQQDSNLRPFA